MDRYGIAVPRRSQRILDLARRVTASLRTPAQDTDQLTNVATRQAAWSQVTALYGANAGAASQQLAVLFIDLDRFKSINDVHGHNVGDAVLASVASRLLAGASPSDIVARNGGDEFVVILTDPGRTANAERIARDLQEALAEPFRIGDDRLHITTSIGVACPTKGSPEQLLRNADIALLSAKDGGRDRVVVFDTEQSRQAQELHAQVALVRRALEDDQLVMVYQPIVSSTGSIVGVEALARCTTIEGVLVLPESFYQGASRANLVMRLDWHAFAQACRDAARLVERFPTCALSVACNFSPKSLAQSDFASRVLREIRLAGITPAQICIEITETAAFDAAPSSIAALNELSRAGIRIALDDFGTGFSSLTHLVDLPLTGVKIDRSFTSRLHEGGTHYSIARAATDLAHSLGLTVVAEGVETLEQVQAVSQLGIEHMQGWQFAPGLGFDDLVAYISQSKDCADPAVY